MSRKNNTGKSVLIILLSLLGIAALVGGSIAISKRVKVQTTSDIPAVQESSEKTTPKTSSSEAPISSNSSAVSSSAGNNETTIPTINCSLPQEVYWYNTEDQVELNESLLVATLNGLPANATDLNVGASSSASVFALNIALPLPKQNSCFQSPNNIDH